MKVKNYIAFIILALISLFLIGVGISTFVTHQFIVFGVFIGVVGIWRLWMLVKAFNAFKAHLRLTEKV